MTVQPSEMTFTTTDASDRVAAPDLVQALIARHFGSKGGELQIDGLSINDLARRHGTPLFIYDLATVNRQYRALREALPPRFSICYSIKANPNQALLRFFVEQGCGLEIASSGELRQALVAGCLPENILFAGPGKTAPELSAALEAGVGEIHIESLTEARRISELARQKNLRARVALRVNPAAAVEGGGMRMGAKPVPFGIDEDQLPEVVNELITESSLQIVGLHLFVGTQILDHETLLRQYRAGLQIARKLSGILQRPLETLDFGGGLGVPYFAHEKRLDLYGLSAGLSDLMRDIEDWPETAQTRILVEPGRFLVAESGIYVTRVNDIKVSRGKKFVITDGGMHHHLAASGNLGQTIKRNFPVALVNKLNRPAEENVEIVGALCTPLDVLARTIDLPAIEIGDLIGVFQSGAYARAASPLGFLSHPSPPEILVDRQCDRVVRHRGTAEDYLADQLF